MIFVNNPLWVGALIIAPLALLTGCQSMDGGPGWGPNQAAGTLFGGASGGVIGAAIGSHQGKTAEGALIGGLVGGALGNALGGEADATDRRVQQAAHQQHLDNVRSALSHDQVIQLHRQGLSDEVIANQIHNQGIARRPHATELAYLKSQGVSDRVLAAMQSAWTPGEMPSSRVPHHSGYVVAPPAVIVEDYGGWGPPVFYRSPRYYCPPGPRRSTQWGFSVGF